MLKDEQIKKFKEIYKNRFGQEISREDVLERGSKLVRLMEIIYQPITKQELLEFKKYKKAKTLTKLNQLNN